eukprot:scaffold9344_cov161-Isochrysis_galbana.AAC.1
MHAANTHRNSTWPAWGCAVTTGRTHALLRNVQRIVSGVTPHTRRCNKAGHLFHTPQPNWGVAPGWPTNEDARQTTFHTPQPNWEVAPGWLPTRAAPPSASSSTKER